MASYQRDASNVVELFHSTKTHQLNYNGTCAVDIKLLSKILVIEPDEKDTNPFEISLHSPFFQYKNIFCHISSTYNVALVFPSTDACKVVYDMIVKYQADTKLAFGEQSLNQEQLETQILIPLFKEANNNPSINESTKNCIKSLLQDLAIADTNDGNVKSELDEIFAENLMAINSCKSSNESMVIKPVNLLEANYHNIGVKTEPNDAAFDESVDSDNIDLKMSVITEALGPVISTQIESRKRRKSLEPFAKFIDVKQCKLEIPDDPQESPFEQLPEACTLITTKKIIKSSHFLIHRISRGSRNHELIQFISDQKNLCYPYFFEKKCTGNRFTCISCHKLKHSAVVHLRCNNDNGEFYLECGLIKHICTPVKYDERQCKYIEPCTSYSSLFLEVPCRKKRVESQRLHNSIQTPTSSINHRKTLTNVEKKEIVQRWKNGYLETKSILQGTFVQILEDSQVTGHICIHCEKYFIGSHIGGAQRRHECVKPSFLFSTSQKQIAYNSSINLVKMDFFPFDIVSKAGFLEFTKNMLEIGAELGQQKIKTVTIDDVKNLLPHPSTISNHINELSTKKQHFYAILKKKSSDSGVTLMLDTLKSYQYTDISLAFIDEEWRFQTVLINIVSGHDKCEITAAEYVYEKATEFMNNFGIDIESLNAIITHEADDIISTFGNRKNHIICICHLISSICNNTIKLRGKDKVENLSIDESLEKICGLKKKLKEVVTTIKNRTDTQNFISSTIYQQNEIRFLSFSTSLDTFLSLNEENHLLIDSQLFGHQLYGSYLELVEAKNDLQTIYNILYPAVTALKTFEVIKAPTLHLVLPALSKIYKAWENIANLSDPIEYSMKTAGLWAIQEKVANLHDYHYFAVILDPNSKMEVNNFLLPDRSGQRRGITELIQKLRETVKSYVIQTKRYRHLESAPICADNPFAEALTNAQSDSADLFVDNDITKYLADGETYTTSILGYWKQTSSHYPYLSSFAKHLLSIPASSCSLNRSFNAVNMIDCKERAQFDQETLTNIILSNAVENYLPH